MTGDTIFVFSLVGLAGILFASGRVRLDVVALLVVVALAISGVLSPREALAGFGDPVVILVAGLLIVGDMLTRSGIAYSLGAWMLRVGGDSEARLLILLMLVAGGLGAVMSSTAVVAIFIPIALNIASRTNINASRLLIPLAFGALISGMLTLIATTPNLVVSQELDNAGFTPFNFFSFTPIGVAVLAVAVAYFLLIGCRLLPGSRVSPPTTRAKNVRDLVETFGVTGTVRLFAVPASSPLAGQSLEQSELHSRYGVRVIAVRRSLRLGSSYVVTPPASTLIRAGDLLVAQGSPEESVAMTAATGLQQREYSDSDREELLREGGVASVLIHPESELIGKTLREAAFRSRYRVQVLGLRRGGENLDHCGDRALASGDALLVVGSWHCLARLQSETHEFILLDMPVEIQLCAPARERAPVALTILAGMVLLSALEIVPVVVAVLLAVLAAVFTRCLTMEDAYRSIHWSSVVLIAGMLPIADALEKTGGIDLLVDALIQGLGDGGPYTMMSALFFLAASFGLVLSNTATAVLLAPIAIGAAEVMQVSPYAYAMTVAIAASAAFVTPVSTPVVTLVVEPGNYRFLDFVKVGLPMLLLTWLVTIVTIPLLFPF